MFVEIPGIQKYGFVKTLYTFAVTEYYKQWDSINQLNVPIVSKYKVDVFHQQLLDSAKYQTVNQTNKADTRLKRFVKKTFSVSVKANSLKWAAFDSTPV